MVRPVVVIVFVLISLFGTTGNANLASGAPFVVDATSSFLTISGTYNSQPIVAQPGSSLTNYYGGQLDVLLSDATSIRLLGSSMYSTPQVGSFLPAGTSADYAIQVDHAFGVNNTGYATMGATDIFLTSGSLAVAPGGAITATGINLSFLTRLFSYKDTGPSSATTTDSLKINNVGMSPASFTTVGNTYRVVIPFQGTGTASTGLRMTLSGQIVASRPVAGANVPDFVNGGFEEGGVSTDPSAGGWIGVEPGTPNNYASVQRMTGPLFKPNAAGGANAAFINVENGTASMYQTILPGGSLEPNMTYTVTFDVGNRDLTDNGNLPNNDMDPFISVKAFFTLGGGLVDFSQHIGEAYQLLQLSSLADGTWSRNNSIVLDTSLLTPEQLAQPLNFVFQATSTTTLNRGQVNFDNVRLTAVPEPSTVALATVGMLLLVGRAWMRRR